MVFWVFSNFFLWSMLGFSNNLVCLNLVPQCSTVKYQELFICKYLLFFSDSRTTWHRTTLVIKRSNFLIFVKFLFKTFLNTCLCAYLQLKSPNFVLKVQDFTLSPLSVCPLRFEVLNIGQNLMREQGTGLVYGQQTKQNYFSSLL